LLVVSVAQLRHSVLPVSPRHLPCVPLRWVLGPGAGAPGWTGFNCSTLPSLLGLPACGRQMGQFSLPRRVNHLVLQRLWQYARAVRYAVLNLPCPHLPERFVRPSLQLYLPMIKWEVWALFPSLSRAMGTLGRDAPYHCIHNTSLVVRHRTPKLCCQPQ
jgi:hypothetical protein